MIIYEAIEKDRVTLAQMAKEIWDNDNLLELEKEFIDMIHNKNETAFILCEGDLPVAFANVSLRCDYVEGTDSSPVGYLERIFVKEAYRKKSYARSLVMKCEEWARDMGAIEFASDCLLDNRDSYLFHLAIGFVEANRIICFRKNI
ncbi:aminoglycoside 6'-N-acetyltransferase [Anaerococcus sp.]|uniref:aminoglycoside 6'-N-acetyltransferase n=1 Tax=Anaerococcus sp. TaxID=1872515 RepID=UPI002A749C33|nr:aminoglycoside 6'-N-acetyltransferase [Anaerococcus sp.]MDY2927106.1 aminoglycoside 6'-N-acetyltransferase [Anaerococcus sp.]